MFAGALGHGLDWRKSSGGFIHGVAGIGQRERSGTVRCRKSGEERRKQGGGREDDEEDAPLKL